MLKLFFHAGIQEHDMPVVILTGHLFQISWTATRLRLGLEEHLLNGKVDSSDDLIL